MFDGGHRRRIQEDAVPILGVRAVRQGFPIDRLADFPHVHLDPHRPGAPVGEQQVPLWACLHPPPPRGYLTAEPVGPPSSREFTPGSQR